MAVTINASTSAGLVQTADTTGILQLQTAGTTAVTINTSQNVGIGTTSPDGDLQIYRNAATSLIRMTSSTTGVAGIDFGDTDAVDRGQVRYFNNGDYLLFATANSERMRIDSSGNVLVGTSSTTPRDFTSGTGTKLPTTGGPFEFATSDTNVSFFNFTGSASGSGNFINFRQQGVGRGSISTNGSTTAYNTSSDYRLKDNIVPITGALDKIALLKPVSYTWKETGNDSQGFIAHELQSVVPDCVTGEKDAVDEEGKPVYQGVDTSFLVATLTAAIQEQQTIINDLKARIETLEGAA
jgi:hypothetical protein